MEKIISVQKESVYTGSKLSLSKLRLNMEKDITWNIEKTIKYLIKNLSEEERTEESLMNLLQQGMVEPLKKVENIPYMGLGRKVEEKYFIGIDKSEEGLPHVEYYDLGNTLPMSKHHLNYKWKLREKGTFTVFNGLWLIALDKLKKEILLDSEEELSNYIDKVFDEYVRVKNKFLYKFYSFKQNEEILKRIMDRYYQDLNVKLMEDYRVSQNSDYAKSFMTKKNINQSTLEKMDNNLFLNNGFSFVEFDNETDLAKIEQVEAEWVKLYRNTLPKLNTQTSLRFRKLGNHNAIGLYYPTQHCLCVDIRDIQAMVHEYGHLIDYEFQEEPLSLGEEFRDIITDYRLEVEALPKDSFVAKKKTYYTTPTEVFARGYELYLAEHIGVTSSFLKGEEDYRSGDDYACFTSQTREKIYKYFDGLFDTGSKERVETTPKTEEEAPLLKVAQKNSSGGFYAYILDI